MKKMILRFSAAIFAFAGIVLSVQAQQYRPDVFAITGARIVTVSGKTIERGTLVIRDGLIEAVDDNAKVPADAQTIDGEGLTIYPGFIDAYSNLGIAPRAPQRGGGGGGGGGGQGQSQGPESNSNYPEGLQPEEAAFDELKAGEAQFETQRNAGITTALTVGADGIFNGQSAIIDLAGDSVSSMIIRSPFAEHVTYTTLRGGTYPTSLMGTFSALRQMFLDAQRLQEIQRMYAANPRGIRRPEADASLQALIPVVNGQMPVVFNANTEREIIRTLDLAREFKLKAIISGGREAWKVAARLKEQDVPVLVSLNFPVRTLAASKDEDPESLETLRLRVEAPKNAARLKQAGVRFAFQTDGIKNLSKDFLGNVVIATENGLAKDDALWALTIGAAEILGIDNRLGSIETGKIANLVVFRGDMFDKDRTITHVFVDGKLFEQKEKPKAPASAGTPGGGAGTPGGVPQIGGTYQINIDVPGMPLPGTLILNQQTAVLSGSLQTSLGTSEVRDGKVTAEGFTFATTVEFQGQTFDIFFTGKTTGNQIEGTISSPQGTITFSGTKNP
ncbi:MAG: amidohydrolase family protein [Pyrinomonadaceae bacterium]